MLWYFEEILQLAYMFKGTSMLCWKIVLLQEELQHLVLTLLWPTIATENSIHGDLELSTISFYCKWLQEKLDFPEMKKIILSRHKFLFVCLWFYVLLGNFSPKWRIHLYRWRASNFDPYSALVAIEQWGFFSVPYILWHRSSVYNGHLRGPVTFTPIVERLPVKLF